MRALHRSNNDQFGLSLIESIQETPELNKEDSMLQKGKLFRDIDEEDIEKEREYAPDPHSVGTVIIPQTSVSHHQSSYN